MLDGRENIYSLIRCEDFAGTLKLRTVHTTSSKKMTKINKKIKNFQSMPIFGSTIAYGPNKI